MAVMTERDRLSLKKWNQEWAEQEEKRRIERERPVREAEEANKRLQTELAQKVREGILSGRDADVYVAPETIGVSMSIQKAKQVNAAAVDQFMRSYPDYYACAHNRDALLGYFDRNGLSILAPDTVAKAYLRLKEYGFIIDRPAPEPPPPAAIHPIVEHIQKGPRQQPRRGPETFKGIDPLTGNERAYTKYEVDRMTSDEYRRAFKLVKADLMLPFRSW